MATPSTYYVRLINGFNFNLQVRLNLNSNIGQSQILAPGREFNETYPANLPIVVQVYASNDSGNWIIYDVDVNRVSDGTLQRGVWTSVLFESDVNFRQDSLPFYYLNA